MHIGNEELEPIVDSLRMKELLRSTSDKRGKIARMIHDHVAFYGGTALRIFHGLNRFSEDLDFSLVRREDDARLEHALAESTRSSRHGGSSFDVESKSTGERTGIESAFLKGNTRINLLSVGVPQDLARLFPHSAKVTIKLEMDTTPPPDAATEVRTRLLPLPFQVRLYDLPSLFAGKLHAAST